MERIIIKKRLGYLLGAVLLGFLTLWVSKSCDESYYKQNIAAYEDSLRVYKLKDSSSVAAKKSLLASQSVLQSKLKQQGIQIGELQRKLKSKVVFHSNIKTKIIFKEIQPEIVKDTVYIDSLENRIIKSEFVYNDKYLSFLLNYARINDSSKVNISNINIPVDLSVGKTKDNQVYVLSKNPYLQIQSIESIIVPEKKKKWGFGFGFGPGILYNPYDKNFHTGFGLLFGIQYKL